MFASAISASANKDCQGDWKERMMSEKIAFLTLEIGLTPAEAQEFWPVYNAVNKDRDEAMGNVFRSFRALEEGLEAGKSEKEISKLLEAYLDAMERQKEVDEKAVDQFRKVLSTEQLAKMYVGEEKFRRQHIRKLHNSRPGERN